MSRMTAGQARREAAEKWFERGHIFTEWAVNAGAVCLASGGLAALNIIPAAVSLMGFTVLAGFSLTAPIIGIGAAATLLNYAVFPTRMLQSDRHHYIREIAREDRSPAAAGTVGFVYGVGSGLMNALGTFPATLFRTARHWPAIKNYPGRFTYVWSRLSGNYPGLRY